ncbi:AAA-domain-containing protein [Aureobasidium subglaciale]|nr:AAA-domain-containing protein [Aureobasidium subglaciale]
MTQVHVDVRLKDTEPDDYIPRTEIEDAFHSFLIKDYLHPVNNGEELRFDNFKHSAHVDTVQVTGIGMAIEDTDSCFDFAKVHLKVHAYHLHPHSTVSSDFQASKNAQAKIINLPNQCLAGVWESLKFDESQIIHPEQILNEAVRTVALLYQADKLPGAMNINRLILFHGPPGCGKSTLCRALAHKLVIRLSRIFRGGRLFEINTQDLLSKFYSESGKLVSEMFEKILNMANDSKELICVLIDEIESIAASRQASTKNGECADTVRTTNQLLTALDRIKSKPNIVVLCTSNLLESILTLPKDTAFLDRVYDAVSVPPPCASAVYTILSNILNTLIDAGVITYEPWGQTIPRADESALTELNEYFDDSTHLPTYESLIKWTVAFPHSPGPLLQTVALKCAGYSGRKLMKLPFLAITKYTWAEKCTISDAIKALRLAVKHELAY